MKILVTGGAGYIGSVLVPLLLEEGHSVRVLDSLMYGGAGLMPNFRKSNFDFVRGDIRDHQTVHDAIRGCDVVIHLAAIVGFPACRKHAVLAEAVNLGGTKVVAEEAGRERLVLFGSTGSNYGALVDQVCTEETPLNPLSLYGKTKTAAERHLLEHCNTIAYRFATAFGLSPRMRLDLLVNDFVYTAMKLRYLVVYEAHFMRTFIHVHDIARSFLFALDNADRMRGQVYNVGSESLNYSKAQLCEMIGRKVDYYLHLADVGEDADKRNYVVSYDKISSLGYHTTVTLEEGIDELVRGLALIEINNPYSNA
ncbi:MAG: NAD(P)-dependent oxidoreductase [Acidobacteria bacterium]|nr:NAD(P)-dependent oxidoreductase [Acidobacteriota bacterium]